MTTFKLFFKNGEEEDIRRITLNNPDWDSFTRELVELYPQQFHPELRICYKDEEGDFVTVSSQKEWALMLETVHDSIKKLYVSEGKNSGKYFKDGPAPAALGAYEVDEGEKKEVDDDTTRKLEFAVPHCLERLLPGGRLTPYNLPSWLQGAVQVKRVEGEVPTVDLDIDVCTLFESLHEQALGLIKADAEPELLKRAKDFLQSMLELAPNHPLANYNMACAEALLGEAKDAIESLKRAIEGGYSNLTHMIADSDLFTLHDLPEWEALLDMLRPKEEKKEEEPVVEEKKEVAEEKKEEPPVVEEEKPVEVPVVEEKKEPETPVRWADELGTLASMGFTNTEVNTLLLDEHKGNLVKVVNAILFSIN